MALPNFPCANGVCLLLALWTSIIPDACGQIFSWDFNEGSGNASENHGSAGPATLSLRNPEGMPDSFFTADGGGASGQPGDRAFDLSSATGMGANDPTYQGPAGIVPPSEPGLTALSGLTSFTITGWFKPASQLAGAARIVVTSLFNLQTGGTNRILLSLDDGSGKPVHLSSGENYSYVDSWMFFAVTYDGSNVGDNVHFYIGIPSSGRLEPAGSGRIDSGPLGSVVGGLVVGNNSIKGIRPFQGLIDDLSIYGSPTDSSGALSMEQVEAIYTRKKP